MGNLIGGEANRPFGHLLMVFRVLPALYESTEIREGGGGSFLLLSPPPFSSQGGGLSNLVRGLENLRRYFSFWSGKGFSPGNKQINS